MAIYDYVNATGVITPNSDAIYAEVLAEFQAALGENINAGASTVVGRLISAEVTARLGVARINAELANQVNPDIAGGVYLLGLCSLAGISIPAATKTLVRNVDLTGQRLASIPAGVKAVTAAGDEFESLSAVTLSSQGQATVDFQAVNAGAVLCAVGALTTLASAPLGLESVRNSTAGVVGKAFSSDADIRDLRYKALALQARNTPDAIISQVWAVSGVTRVVFLQNPTGTAALVPKPQTAGATFPAFSVWLCVEGGSDVEIAKAILRGGPGPVYSQLSWLTPVSVTVQDPTSGQDYTVNFDRPATVQFDVKLTIKQITGTTVTTDQLVRAVRDWGEAKSNGVPNLDIGVDVYPFEIGAYVNERFNVVVKLVEVKVTSTETYSSDPLNINTGKIGKIVNVTTVFS